MTLSSGASRAEPVTPRTEDERLAAAAQFRRFGSLLLLIGAVMAVAGIAAAVITANPVFLVLLVTAVIDVVLAVRQFAAARKV